MAGLIQEQIDRLAALSGGMPRGDFVAHLRLLEQEAGGVLAAESSRRWYPGRGLRVSSCLSDWKDAVIAAAAVRLGGLPYGLSIVAVGGYGRGELSPFSDVDLMMLGAKAPGPEAATFIADLLYILWDLGYRLGSSVRSVREVVVDAREDLHLLTALFTARLVLGDAAQVARMRSALRRHVKRIRLRFLRERAEEMRQFLRNPGGAVLVKEPNLKTNPGGLRSVHLMLWLNYAFDGEPGLPGLARLFSPLDHRRLVGAYDFVLSNRNLLHFTTGRKEDVLHIEHQAAAAEAFGIRGDGPERATRLMRRYYEKASDILTLLVRAVDELTLAYLRPRRRRTAVEGLFLAASRLYVCAESTEGAPAPRALGALLECVRSRAEPSGSLLSYLASAARGLPGGGNGLSRETFLRFRDILSLPDSSTALNALQLSGFLHAYLAPLRLVRHRVVHNSFHQYTVDQHSIEAVRALESFSTLAAADPTKYRLASGLAAKYRDNLWVVKLALLLHDTGKAYPGDHARNGAELARGYLRDLPTESLFKDMVVFLIENHLLLSNLARRGSVEEQAVIDHLASEFILTPFPEESLELLYLMTCADVSATNPRAYSGYTAAMLEALFLRTARVLGSGAGPGDRADPQTRIEELVANLAGQPAGVADFARALGLRYCASNSAQEVIEDYEGFLAVSGADAGEAPPGPPFLLRVVVFNDHLKVKILARDRIGLFSVLSGILLLNGADVVRADIHTYRGAAIDEFVVTGVHGYDILERRMEKELSAWIEDLKRSFDAYLARPDELDRLVTEIERTIGETGRHVPAAFHRETRVSVTASGERGLQIDLSCTDRPALLHDVTKRLAALGCDVRSAVIDTTGWYVRDRFEAEMRAPVDLGRLEAEIRASAT